MIELNRELAHAIATDAANANMRNHGRTRWNEEDYNLACEQRAALLGYCPECCMDLPDHWPTCSASNQLRA